MIRANKTTNVRFPTSGKNSTRQRIVGRGRGPPLQTDQAHRLIDQIPAAALEVHWVLVCAAVMQYRTAMSKAEPVVCGARSTFAALAAGR
jgi:hypothetical protein